MKYLYILVIAIALFLRLYALLQFPPSLYWEEAALGYDAYSILKTGKDHHGNVLPIIAFESFGDWKPSGYFYILVPFIALFGLTEWAVRIPTVLAGMSLIIGTALLAKRIGVSQLLTLAVGAISPWAIILSRAGWEVMSASAFLVWGNYFLLNALANRKITRNATLAGLLCFAAAMYTYHATRLIVPLQLIGLALYYLSKHIETQRTSVRHIFNQFMTMLFVNRLILVIAVALFATLICPIIFSLGDTKTNHRFQETSIFSEIRIITDSNQFKEVSNNSVLSRIFYHRYVLFGREILHNFFSHFSLDFLYIHGDANLRHSVQYFGQLYHIELFFILLGAYIWLQKRTSMHLYLLYWLIIAIVPAALTTATPHALRILPSLPIFLLLIGQGVEMVHRLITGAIRNILSNHKMTTRFTGMFVTGVILFLYVIEFAAFWRYYTSIYPKVASSEWQYGYSQMVAEVERLRLQNPTSNIYITREQGRPAMYYWFFTKADPRDVQAENSSAKKDQGEYLSYKNMSFIDGTNQISEPGIVVSSERFKDQLSQSRISSDISQIRNLKNEVVWDIYIVK